jgi:glycosyltransferase involved in cell wall biosynthesis
MQETLGGGVRRADMRILVIVNGKIGERIAGPQIRGLEIARALAGDHSVSVVAEEPPTESRGDLRFVPASRRAVAFEAHRHDAVIAPALPPYLLAALGGARTVAVADQYDPVWLEIALFHDQPGIERTVSAQLAMRRFQLRFADVIACAGRRQRGALQADLERLPASPRRAPAIVDVPFGIGPPPTRAKPGALRRRFPVIGPHDPVILWWGKVWKWFDAETAIRAFASVVRSRPDARLVISAGRAPAAAFDRSETTGAARELARDLGLLDRNVLFLDDWVPYETRGELLADADVGLTLHAATAEAPFAARARYMDYLWAGLPCVLAAGDDIAERFGRSGFARLVPPGDEAVVARRITELIGSSEMLKRARRAGLRLANEYRWSRLVDPLAEAIELRRRRPRRPLLDTAVHRAACSYYLRRASDDLRSVGSRAAGSSRPSVAFHA